MELPKSLAEVVANLLDNDRSRFITPEGVSFGFLVKHTKAEAGNHSTRYMFDDGSAVVVVGRTWDIVKK